jgi:hypothetical protein
VPAGFVLARRADDASLTTPPGRSRVVPEAVEVFFTGSTLEPP